jgi:uncharacterized LabA/DUF88 family protein
VRNTEHNIAYIDGANLHRGVLSLGWEFDYTRFRIWLREKYGITTAYLFLGLVPRYKDLYTFLQEAGYILVFKETIVNGQGIPKGNCDADLVLRATRDVFETIYDKAIIVSSDGDYASLVKFLNERNKFRTILSPYPQEHCSVLLKRTGTPISYIIDQRGILEIKKKKPPMRT